MEYNAFEFQNIDDYNKGIQLTEPLFNINSIYHISSIFFLQLDITGKTLMWISTDLNEQSKRGTTCDNNKPLM